MFKIVYVLTSNEKDYYYNQLMISLLSVRKYMKDQIVEVVTDDKTYATLVGNRKEIFNYAKVTNVEIDEKYSQKERSRFLKTSLRNLVTGDFLFIDCDTVICCDFSNFMLDMPLAMALDRNCKLSDWIDKGNQIRETAEMLDFDLSQCDSYFNSGVIWAKDCAEVRRFFAEWHKYWLQTLKIGMCVDQLSLNYVNTHIMKMIQELDGCWNCQVTLKPAGVEYIANARIIHYFNTNPESPFKLCDENIIREGWNTKNVQEIIENPRNAFRKSYIVTRGSELDEIQQTKIFKLMYMLFKKRSPIFMIPENILYKIKKISKKGTKEKRWERY